MRNCSRPAEVREASGMPSRKESPLYPPEFSIQGRELVSL